MIMINKQLQLIRMNRPGLARIILLSIVAGFLLCGCTTRKTYTLMPTPVLYLDSSVDPFAHLSEEQRNTRSQIFYATNRVPETGQGTTGYGNGIGSTLHFGSATVRMGSSETSWDTLHQSSLSAVANEPIVVSLEEISEQAVWSKEESRSDDAIPDDLKNFFNLINRGLSRATDKEIMIYVHGTKVDFTNSTILTAEIDHFAGRDYVSLAFAWPSHQNILSYLFGIDVRRARESSSALAEVLKLLAEYTNAEHINILSYSAGGRVTSKALFELRQSYSNLGSRQLKEKFRLGSVVFAATDVEVDVFLQRLHAVSDLAEQVVITISDNDNVLIAAKKVMGGMVRAGASAAEIIEEDFIIAEDLRNVEIIDVSIGHKVRGFDIIGHHYWYRHPWMSSDIVFLMRTDLPAARRGLTATELEGVWYLSHDYPEKIRNAARAELDGQW